MELTGKLHSVDQYLNIKLEDVQVVNKERYPQLVSRSWWCLRRQWVKRQADQLGEAGRQGAGLECLMMMGRGRWARASRGVSSRMRTCSRGRV